LRQEAFACQACGFAWGRVNQAELSGFLAAECDTVEDEARVALRMATRLESKGKLDDAIGAYEEIVQRFRGTEAAKDAEASLRSLKQRNGAG
jgi:hypothetical protein